MCAEQKTDQEQAGRVECSFRCDVSVRVNSERIRVPSGNAAFQITHVADFTEPALAKLAEKLRKNDERAVPWVAIAIPLDGSSFDWEGAGNASWRVFLPLAEEGPSTCILNAAVFVDPSRRAVEFRTDGSDETLRKSQWNRTLVERLLAPLLREACTTVMDNAPELIEQEPKKYLSLFPTADSGMGSGVSRRCCTRIVPQRPVAAQTLRRVEGTVRCLGGPGRRRVAARKAAGVAHSVQGGVQRADD